MLIDLIVGSAVLLGGLYCGFWLSSPALRARIEQPKHDFLQQVQRQHAPPTDTSSAHRSSAP